MMKTKSTQSNPSASPRQIKEKPKGKKRSGPKGKTKEYTSARIPERDSAQKAQTERYEQIKYEIAGESGEPGKHKDGGGLRKRMKGIGRSRKTSAKTQESS